MLVSLLVECGLPVLHLTNDVHFTFSYEMNSLIKPNVCDCWQRLHLVNEYSSDLA